MPDFARAFRQGSPFLELAPPQDLDEALSLLLVLWQNCPTITGFPARPNPACPGASLPSRLDSVPNAAFYAFDVFWTLALKVACCYGTLPIPNKPCVFSSQGVYPLSFGIHPCLMPPPSQHLT